MSSATSSSILQRGGFIALVIASGLFAGSAFGQNLPSPNSPYQLIVSPAPTPAPTPTPVPPPPTLPSIGPSHQTEVEQLTQSNRELLDLLKKQQAVLEDIQYDRRLTARQVTMLQERLETLLQEKTQLQDKNDKLQAALAEAKASPPVQQGGITNNPTPPTADTPRPPPATYLPPPQSEGAPGTKSWHRLFTLKGSDAKSTDLFHVEGPQWRVVWHNQDKPGETYKNTSALFINAYPKNDTIPQKVCAKLGSGGDATELQGPGNYYLKIESSGGTWELAVEDFK